MKINYLSKITLAVIATLSLVNTGCKKDKDDAPTERALSFHLHTLVGNTAANYTSVFTDNTGRKFNISDCRYYISNIVLIKNDGTEYPITGKVLLANPNTMSYALGNVPVGKYKGFKFIMGLDSTTNHADPATYPTSSPLSYQNPSNHWGWNSGYIFMLFEGKVDVTPGATGSPDTDYFYHVGMDAMKRTIDFSTSAFEVKSSEDLELGILFDLRKVLNNVDMTTENATHTMDNMPLATKIANNWTTAFSIE
jgi:hypothetical protein